MHAASAGRRSMGRWALLGAPALQRIRRAAGGAASDALARTDEAGASVEDRGLDARASLGNSACGWMSRSPTTMWSP